MRRILAGVVSLVVVAAAAFVLTGAQTSGKGETYKIVFDNAFGLTQGGDFKIAGVRAGQTSRFSVSKERPRKAVVEIKITQKGVGQLREDSLCDIKPQSLIGEYYVDCREGKGKALADGETLPVERTSSTIPVDLVNNVLRLPYRERLRLIIGELGTGLAGRPQDLAEVLRRAHPGLRETSRTLNILAGQRQVINKFIGDAATVVAELDNRKADVSRWVTEAGDAAELAASRREDLKRNIQLLPTTLARLQPYMRQLRNLANDQIPTLRDLRTAAPDVNRLLARLGPFSEAARPAVRALGRTAVSGTAALRQTRQEVAALRKLASDVPGTAKPLRQFLQTMDDARRSVERDPRAAASAPPAPDKTADRTSAGRDGFTGFEAFWNYAYWQALAINARDNKSHILRINAFPGECAPYRATDEGAAAVFQQCTQALGPNQPGINEPDPTAGGAGASREDRATSTRVSRERDGAGDAKKDGSADAGGQRASELPRTPEEVQKRSAGVLDDLLGGRVLGDGPAPRQSEPERSTRQQQPSSGNAEMLLDYLLKP
jgi:ABC-type transporter Mla subunit MlaD